MKPLRRHALMLSAALALAGLTSRAGADDAPAPTFSKDIAPIFQNRCQNCHRTGVQFTPMGLMTYEETRPWVKSIRKAVSERTMPPWHADPAYGKFKNNPSMPEEEVKLITRWIDAGAPEGNPADMPPAKQFDDKGWQIGEPDAIIDTGVDFKLPAEGVIPYQYFAVKTNFEEDKWIEAMEARAGNLDVVHHVVIYVRNPKEGIQLPDAQPNGLGAGLLGALSPGNTPSMYMPGQGKLLKKGATIIFNMHYTTCGRETTDRSYIGLKFHKGPVEKQVITRGVANVSFRIPPQAKLHEVVSKHRFAKDVTLISLMPHMHYRGKDFKYILHYPDGRSETILSTPNYDFDWQVYYHFEEPLKLPKGTTMECIAHFSNTAEEAEGRTYFDPNSEVRFGEQSHEEMMIGWIDYTVDEENLLLGQSGGEEDSAPTKEQSAEPAPATTEEGKQVSLNQ